MEDYQTYLESGRLEQYALGELDPAARAEVESWAARYPQVRQELDELLTGLDVYAEAQSRTPPAGARERILSRVLAEIGSADVAAPAPAPAVPTMRVSASNPHLATAPTPPVAARRGSGWAIAASVALLLSLGANALLYSRWQQVSTDLVAAQNSQARFAQTSQVVEHRLQGAESQLQVLRSPEYKLVALAGTPAHATARARVLYNAATHRVFLDVQALPALPVGKQYQLWALDKGKPIDAGVLAANTATGEGLQQMKDIASAQTFAMTVEPTGGSVGPTLSTMTVVGNI
ncbi:anti-sigma factor [Hymenobacter psoromatis]|uniref:anti-sigma factor n=1 Tax=Hymenobacter psoromatis TaxID=1484116 RepID=UPI001CBB1A66